MTLQTWYLLIIGALLCYLNLPGPALVMANEEEEFIHLDNDGSSNDYEEDFSSFSSTSSSHPHDSWKETKQYRPNEPPWYQETGLFPRIRKGLVVLNDGRSIFISLFLSSNLPFGVEISHRF